jgi:hypothetical protein
MIDVKQEAKDAIERYYKTSEGQDEILLALQKGGKLRTLNKLYSKNALLDLMLTFKVMLVGTELQLSPSGCQRILELCQDRKGKEEINDGQSDVSKEERAGAIQQP